jgi:hypothetical protein
MLNSLKRYKLIKIILMICLVFWLLPLGTARSFWSNHF